MYSGVFSGGEAITQGNGNIRLLIILLKHAQAPLRGAALDTDLLKHVNGLKGELVVTGPDQTQGFRIPHSPSHHSRGGSSCFSFQGRKSGINAAQDSGR